MRKLLVRLFSFISILVALGLIAVLFMWAKLPNLLANHLAEKLKVPVTIEGIDLSLQRIGIQDLMISNLPNSLLKEAFSTKTMTFNAPLTTYFEDSIVIDNITLDQIYLGLEFDSARGTKGNWSTLMQNVQSQEAPAKHQKEKTVFIRELVLTNIQVEVAYRDSKDIKKLAPIDRIVLKNINSQEGFPTDQIMRSVLGQMLRSVFAQENLKNMLEGVLQQPESTIDSLLQPFKGLFGS